MVTCSCWRRPSRPSGESFASKPARGSTHSRHLVAVRDVFAASLLAASAGCASVAPPAAIKPVIPQDEASCREAGGHWTRLGIPCETCEKSCDMKTTDAGNRCTDSSQCQGACIAENESAKAGQCAAWAFTFGCYYFMEHGVAQQICVD